MHSERRLVGIFGTVFAIVVLSIVGCGKGPARNGNRLRLDLDTKNPRPFISYYFGGLASHQSSDPFAAGLVVASEGSYFLDTTALSSHLGSLPGPEDKNHDGTLDWDELTPFLQATYYEARGMPTSFDSLHAGRGDNDWFELSVDGVMTDATRRIRVPKQALRNALEHYKANGNELHYPEGTVFVADHILHGKIVETTVMRKRSDGYWDFGVYDSTGTRIPATTTPPKSLTVPTQCAGCHLGSRLYDPEKSFPGAARPGPEGPRQIHWDGPLPSADLVRYFDEHRKRSDHILGLYGTLYVSQLQAQRDAGTIPKEDERLLESLGL